MAGTGNTSTQKRGDDDPAPFDTLIAEQHRMFQKHPKTIFIAAHFGWYPNDLGKLGQLLDAMPNVVVEFGAIIAELGRQPRMANHFLQNIKTGYYLGKIVGCQMNIRRISECWNQQMNIFLIIKISCFLVNVWNGFVR